MGGTGRVEAFRGSSVGSLVFFWSTADAMCKYKSLLFRGWFVCFELDNLLNK